MMPNCAKRLIKTTYIRRESTVFSLPTLKLLLQVNRMSVFQTRILLLSATKNAFMQYLKGMLEGCVSYIFASLFCMSKREHL